MPALVDTLVAAIRAPWTQQHSITRYQAPLEGCQFDSVIAGQYGVTLAPNYTLDEHKRYVNRTELDAAIIGADELAGGLTYTAQFSDELLAAVRADRKVVSVFCQRRIDID